MTIDETKSEKQSVGVLKKHQKTKEKSPDLTGQINIQRHTLEVLASQLMATTADEVTCNIAAWNSRGYDGEPFLSVVISPRYTQQMSPAPEWDFLDFLANIDEGTQ
jgi:hypothetical protein